MAKTNKRDQIRAAAYRVFRDHGYHAASVDQICREAEVSKGSFYWHFDSKQEVFIDILDAWSREVVDELYAQFEAAGKADDYIPAITRALLRESHRGRAIGPLWVEFTAMATREPELRQALSRFFRRIRSSLTELLRPILETHLDEDEQRAVAGAALAAYSGLIVQGMADPDADATTALQRFMRALALWEQASRRASTGDESDAQPAGRTPPDRAH